MNATTKALATKIFFGVLFTGLLLSCHLLNAGQYFFERVDGFIYDFKVRHQAINEIDPRIIILDIDEYSLQEPSQGGEGRWPWSRNRLAKMVNQLFDHYEIAAIGFDVIFSEKDNSSGIQTLRSLATEQGELKSLIQKIEPSLNFDEQFAQSIKNRPVVMAFSFLELGQNLQKGQLPAPLIDKKLVQQFTGIDQTGYVSNLNHLQSHASGAGHINPSLDIDGSIRRLPLVMSHQGQFYEAFSVAMVRTLTGNPPVKVITRDGKMEALEISGSKVFVEPNGNALVPYRGPYGSFEYISAAKVIRQEIPKDVLQGKILLLGTTAPGLLDLRKTPFGNAYPGVEIHANLIAGILDNEIPHIPSWSSFSTSLQLLLGGLIFSVVLARGRIGLATLFYLGGAITFISLQHYFFTKKLVLPSTILLTLPLGFFIFHMAYGYLIESRSKRQMNGLFGQYVPPELVTEMAKDPEKFSMDGQSKNLTVLFSDVRGFTTISEGLDPKTLSELMNAFLTPLTEVIHQHHGTIDKYMGDCIMAFWGAPLEDLHHPENAVRSALGMISKLTELQSEFKARGWPDIQIGVGINTGRVSVGNMGSSLRLAYTVMGDAVNLASRLEGITKEYGVQIIIGEGTKTELPQLETRELDRVRVKGKDLSVTIFEPLGFKGEVNRDCLVARNRFEIALGLYRDRNWQGAKEIILNLLTNDDLQNEKLYNLYLSRIAYFEHNPPPDNWDGSFIFETK